jgi:hypothetical protein
MQMQRIQLSEIDPQHHYCYHIDLELPELRKSLQLHGIQMPVWLIHRNGVKIIDGYRRIHLARILGISEIPVIFFNADDINTVFLSALSINSSQRVLSVIEKINALRITEDLSNSDAIPEVLNILNLHTNQTTPVIVDYVNSIPSWLKKYLHGINISIKVLSKLSRYSVRTFRPWLEMGSTLLLKPTELVQVLEYVEEICKRDKLSSDQLWNELSESSRLRESMTPQQKAYHIKNWLYEFRFPILSRINDDLREKVKKLRKGHQVNLNVSWDRSLENSELKLQFLLKGSNDLDNILEFLQNSGNRDLVLKIFQLMKQFPVVSG